MLHISMQSIEIEIGKRSVGTLEVPQSTVQNRACANSVAGRFVMESNCQLHQALDLPAQHPSPRNRTPDVFEGFVGVEKVSSIEQSQAVLKVVRKHFL